MNVEEICEHLNDIGILDINHTVQFLNLYTGFISNNKNFLNNPSSQKNSIKISLFAYLKMISENDKELYKTTSNIVNSYDKNKLIKQYYCICSLKNILFYKVKKTFFNFLFCLLQKISKKPIFNKNKANSEINERIMYTDGDISNKIPKKTISKSKKMNNLNEITKKMILKQKKINHNNMKKHLYDEQTRINNFSSILPLSCKSRKKEMQSRDEKNYLKQLKSERHYQKLTEKQIDKNDLIDRLYRSEIIKIEDKKRKENADKRKNIKKSPINWDKVNIENSYKISYNKFTKSVPDLSNLDNQEFIRESIENNFSFGNKIQNPRILTQREMENKFQNNNNNDNQFIHYEENNDQYDGNYNQNGNDNNNYISNQNYENNNYNASINNNFQNNENFEENNNSHNNICDSENKVVNENNNDFENEDNILENVVAAQNIVRNNLNNNQIPSFKSTNTNNNNEKNYPENINNKNETKEKKDEKFYDFPQQYTGKETINSLTKNDNNIKEENNIIHNDHEMQLMNNNIQNNNENNQLINNNNTNNLENNESIQEEEFSPGQLRNKVENCENDYYENNNNNFDNNYNNEMGEPYMDEEGNVIMNPSYVDEQGNFINNYNNECYNEYEGEEYEEQDMNMMNNHQNYQENAGNMPKIADRINFNEIFGDNVDQMIDEDNQNQNDQIQDVI